MATIYANAAEGWNQKFFDLYKSQYTDKPFVRICKPGNHLQTQKVAGKIFCDLGLSFDSRTGRITVFSVIDNLGKGASGQAIQNLNLLFGMEETAGLLAAPTYP
jgi:N-acetyl-gamma-glutamyl-phosphate reductase